MTNNTQDNSSNNGGETPNTETGFNHPCIVPVGDIAQGIEAPIMLTRPDTGGELEVVLQPGQTYIFNFQESDVSSFVQDGSNLILSFEDGSTLVLRNFDAATTGDLPSVLAFSDVLDASSIELADADQTTNDDLVEVTRETDVTIISDDGEQVAAVEFIGDTIAEQLQEIAPAAGEETIEDLAAIAEELAGIETAAGDEGGTTGEGAGGFGFQSAFSSVGLIPINDIGPIDPTLLNFDLPSFTEDTLFIDNDEPVIFSPSPQDLDETDLSNGVLSVTDTISVDFGDDTPGTITPSGSFNATGSTASTLTSGGQEITVTPTANGYIGTIDGGTTTVFEFILDSATGVYTYNQPGTLDHADSTDPNDIITLEFGVVASDEDGDSAFTVVEINIFDDAPISAEARDAVDESDLDAGAVTINGQVNVDFGADGGTVAIDIPRVGNGMITTAGRIDTGLTSEGHPVFLTSDGKGVIEYPNGIDFSTFEVFEITLNDDGSYSFDLKRPIDHANSDDPNDVATLNIPIKATDGDGDSVDGSIVIDIFDDGPVANDDFTSGEEDDLIAGNVVHNDDLSEDAAHEVISVEFEGETYDIPVEGTTVIADGLTGTFVPSQVDAGTDDTGTLRIIGEFGTLTIQRDGSWEYQVTAEDPNGTEVFTYTLRDGDGDTDTATLNIRVTPDGEPVAVTGEGIVDETNLDTGPVTTNGTLNVNAGEDGFGTVGVNGEFALGGSITELTHGGVEVVVTAKADGTGYTAMAGDVQVFDLTINQDGTYEFTLLETIDHGDTEDPNDTATISFEFGINLQDADGDDVDGTLTIDILDDGPVAHDDFSGVEEDGLISGNVTHNDELSEDDTETNDDGSLNGNEVISVEFEGETFDVPAEGLVTIEGQFGTFSIGADGVWTYQATAEDPDGNEVFTYTLRDGDGDTDTATLDIRVTPDGEPVAVTSQLNTVDETNLDTGPVTITGALNIDAGVDGFGAIQANGSFNPTGSLNDFTHKGSPITVTNTDTSYIGMAGDIQIFELTLNQDGSYEFTLFETLDHANPLDPNDAIRLNFEFGVTLVDADGDTVDGILAVNVLDDAPVAFDDFSGVEEDGLISGNVTHNDELSEDDGNVVTKVEFEGTEYDVPAEGLVTIEGQFGTFSIGADGVWTYQATAEDPDGNEVFTYTLSDAEGDSDTATLDIRVTPDGEPVAVTGNNLVDETNLASGPVMVEGTLNIDAGIDGFGSVQANGNFNATGSVADFSHKGTPVEVNNVGNLYTGMAGDVKIFDLEINTDGTYKFTLFETLDHANPLDPNDAIRLDFEFGVQLVDADGDTVDGVLNINVLDDGTVARDDHFKVQSESTFVDDQPSLGNGVDTVDETGGFETASGSVAADFGGNGSIDGVVGSGSFSATGTTLTSGGQTVRVDYNENTDTYTGTAGGRTIFTLNIESDGDYTFRQFDALDHPDSNNPNDNIGLNFGIEVTDTDGDRDAGNIRINVRDDGPIAVNDHLFFAETSLIDGYGITYHGNNQYYLDRGAPADFDLATLTKGASFDVLANDRGGADGGLEIIDVKFVETGTNLSGLYEVFIENNEVGLRSRNSGTWDIDRTWNNYDIEYTVRDADGDISTAILRATQIDTNSPLVFDLDGDGVELLSLEDSVFFDSNVDGGILDQTGWAAPDDGFLAIDTNGDGRITDRTELFGDTEGFSDGFAKLAEYDSNGDGLITEADDRYNDLLIWQDVNSDGVSQEGELFTLAELGISDIDVGGAVETDYEINGQHIGFESTFTINGETRTVVDAFFDTIDGNGLVDANERDTTDGASTSNVISASILHNDDLSQDDGNSITSVTIDGQVVAIAAGGSATVQGEYGTLILNSDGTFTYTANNDVAERSSDTFTYTLTDSEGDSDTAELVLWVEAAEIVDNNNNVPDTNDVPDAVNDTINVGQTDPNGGVIGNVLNNDDFGADGRGGIISYTIEGQTVSAGQSINTSLGLVTLRADGSVTLDRPEGQIISSTTDVSRDPSTTQGGGGRDAAVFTAGRNGSTIESSARDASGSIEEVTTTTTTTSVEGGTLDISYTIDDSDGDTDSAIARLNIADFTETSSTSSSQTIFFSSPLVLDLDGDGIELANENEGILFDIDVDGEVEQTGFVAADDGLLAIDRNGDGQITDRTELFGDTEGNADGFEKLADYDSNEDGVIDANDERFGELLIFQDLNQDGISQEGELLGLTEHGIASINVGDYFATDYYINGQFIGFESTFTFADGTEGTVVDAFFNHIEVEGGDVTIMAQSEYADNFIFEAIAEDQVTIEGFNAAEGDIIDISALIEDYDPLQDSIDDFVFTTEVDGDTHISVDVDGAAGPADAQTVAILSDITDLQTTDDSIII